MNGNSPVQEGYQVFFNDHINIFKKFIRDYGNPESKRILAEVKPPSSNQNVGLHFNIEDSYRQKDIYTDLHHQDYDDFTLSEMFEFEKNYSGNRKQGYVNFVKNKFHYYDVRMSYEDIVQGNLVKTPSKNVTDLENYEVNVSFRGLDIPKHMDNNMNNPIKDLVYHLKLKSKYKISYEKLESTVLTQVNDITNKNVKDFHQNNFIFFKDFTSDLDRIRVMKKLEKMKNQTTL